MKSPDEIKKGLEKVIPVHYHLPNPEPRLHATELMELQSLHASASTYIAQLEQRLAQAERERDAMRYDARGCYSCKHEKCEPDEPPCNKCVQDGLGYEWRGVCEENGKGDERSCETCKNQGADGRGICMDCNFNYNKWEPLDDAVD